MFEKVKVEKLYMKIVRQIQDLILTGELKPGMKLPAEKDLAEKFGASRPTLREAICALEILGYVESRKGIGNFIKDFIENDATETILNKLQRESSAYEIFQTRLLIEPVSMYLVVKNINDNEIKILEECLEQMKKGMEQNDFEIFSKNDVLFHKTLGGATNNNMLSGIIKLVNSERENTMIWKKLKVECLKDPKKIKGYFDQHSRIYNAIKEGHSNKAEAEVREHIVEVEEHLFGVDKNFES